MNVQECELLLRPMPLSEGIKFYELQGKLLFPIVNSDNSPTLYHALYLVYGKIYKFGLELDIVNLTASTLTEKINNAKCEFVEYIRHATN